MTLFSLLTRPMLIRMVGVAAPALAGAIMLGAPSSAPQAQDATTEVLPGYWEYTTSAVGIRSTEQKCVRASEINRFFGGLSTRRWQCVYPVREVGNGNARFEGTCTDRRGRRVQVRLRGPYQQESFRFTGGAQLARGTPYLPASITAHRLAAVCPAGAENF